MMWFAGIAQLVERNLAKVEVASSSLVSRSMISGMASGNAFDGGVAKWLCSGLQIRLCRFDSDPRLQIQARKSTIYGLFTCSSPDFIKTQASLVGRSGKVVDHALVIHSGCRVNESRVSGTCLG